MQFFCRCWNADLLAKFGKNWRMRGVKKGQRTPTTGVPSLQVYVPNPANISQCSVLPTKNSWPSTLVLPEGLRKGDTDFSPQPKKKYSCECKNYQLAQGLAPPSPPRQLVLTLKYTQGWQKKRVGCPRSLLHGDGPAASLTFLFLLQCGICARFQCDFWT